MAIRKGYLSFLVAWSLGTITVALNTPPYKHHGGELNDKDSSEWLEWHGLDYDYNMESWNLKNGSSDYWGWSSEDDYSDSEEYSDQTHESITIGTPSNDSIVVEVKIQDKNETVVIPKPEEESNETKENDVSSEVVGYASSAATGTSKNETAKIVNEKENEERDSIMYWDQDGGPDDDDDYPIADDNNNKPTTERLKQLPTDNDPDADKKFNPEKYQELEALHRIEDAMLGQWRVLYSDTNLPCIMLRGKISFVVPVSASWSNREYVELDVPYDAQATGSCRSLNNDYQEIVLKWNVTERNHTYLNTVYLGFGTNWTSEFSDLKVPEDKYALVAVTAAYYNGEVSGEGEEGSGDHGLVSYSVSDLTEFMTPINHSMSCYKEKSIILGRMQLTFSDIQFEAFRPNLETLPQDEFTTSVLCSTDEIIVFDAVMTFIIWFWIGALFVVLVIFVVLLSLSYRRKQATDGFGYKVLTA